MKLVSIDRSGFPAGAILSGDETRVLPVSAVPGEYATDIPVSVIDMLEDWVFWREKLAQTAELADEAAWISIDQVKLLAPVPQPRTFTCIGLNYRDHALETGAPIPEEPVVFAKHTSCVVGPGAPVILPSIADQVDFEAELAVVIGGELWQAAPSQALAAVAGFTIVNDVSARDWQGRTSQWMLSKSFPTFGPMGPALVTTDEFGNGSGKRITLTVNGRVLQDSSTDELIFTVAEVLSHLSQVVPLAPGDVIATGTPAGVGFTRTPPVLLKHGDIIETEIEGIGVLRNPVVSQASSRSGAS